MFADAASLGLPKGAPPELELSVKVYNINQGHNEAIIRRCETLEGYSAFIAKVREFGTEISGGRKPAKLTNDELAGAIKKAVKWCIEHNKLKQFLETHGAEVSSMLMTEWNWDDAMAVLKEETREETWGEAWGEAWGERGEEIARKALTKGFSPEVISDITGLSMEHIERIAGE
jgi:hypothetical protein